MVTVLIIVRRSKILDFNMTMDEVSIDSREAHFTAHTRTYVDGDTLIRER